MSLVALDVTASPLRMACFVALWAPTAGTLMERKSTPLDPARAQRPAKDVDECLVTGVQNSGRSRCLLVLQGRYLVFQEGLGCSRTAAMRICKVLDNYAPVECIRTMPVGQGGAVLKEKLGLLDGLTCWQLLGRFRDCRLDSGVLDELRVRDRRAHV